MQTVGLFKQVTLVGKKKVKALAKFDTGAKTTSIDTALAREAGLGPVLRHKKVKSASSAGHRRAVKKAAITIGKKRYVTEANITDRRHSRCKILVGRDIILNNFVIDVSKTHKGPGEGKVRT
ncbi:MAG: ATP-dependent zinc protease [Candidatus Diapherotrites archaeon]|nr:ATP-dependent zinc protease [Candidatus Diapherotrites archaeon]